MEILRKVANGQTEVWDQRLPLVTLAYRATVHAATGDTPFRLNLGRDLELPEDIRIQQEARTEGVSQYVAELEKRLRQVWSECADEVEAHQRAYKEQHDRHVNKRVFAIAAGDKVFILAKSIRDKGFHPKFQPLFDVLYRVIKVDGYNLTLRVLNRPPGKDILIHRDLCKLFQGSLEDYTRYLRVSASANFPEELTCGVCHLVDALRHGANRSAVQNWVACEVDHEPVVWYHLECVGLKRPLTKKQTWFCPSCAEERL